MTTQRYKDDYLMFTKGKFVLSTENRQVIYFFNL